MSNFSSWHAYAKPASKIPYNPYCIPPISPLPPRDHFVGAVALHMQMAVRLWRLTAERPVQLGLTSSESDGPGEGPVTISFLFPTQSQFHICFVPIHSHDHATH